MYQATENTVDYFLYWLKIKVWENGVNLDKKFVFRFFVFETIFIENISFQMCITYNFRFLEVHFSDQNFTWRGRNWTSRVWDWTMPFEVTLTHNIAEIFFSSLLCQSCMYWE
jgi:hypothetical protein